MSELIDRPDVTKDLSLLKDFQLKTVEHVFQRMYLDPEPARRFLVADEVGLGKTLVARGVIGKAIEHLWDKVKRIDIVYICSNADIARQNINRLRLEVPGKPDFVRASRITLLPIQLKSLANNRVNFVSFTPSTSFDLKSSLGTAEERVLLYFMLNSAWGDLGPGAINLLRGQSGADRFRAQIDSFYELNGGEKTAISGPLQEQFTRALEGHPELRRRFETMAAELTDRRRKLRGEKWVERSSIVGELRLVLARVCLQALEPDLILLDEFQRFKQLLSGTDEAANLARELFEYSDEESQVRVLLLSATPYKMYTLAEEKAEDDHYADFLGTLAFLGGEAGVEKAKSAIEAYRKEVYRLGRNDDSTLDSLRAIKLELETLLARMMVRTERLAVTDDRDGMLRHVIAKDLRLDPSDLRAFVELASVADLVEADDVLTYWKAAPYLLNFMDEYELKRCFTRACEDASKAPALATRLSSTRAPLLPWNEVRAYGKVDPGNARLRWLFEDVVESDAWQMLWIPPALPYYALAGPFASASAATFTKRLVFSAWKVVPKVIAALTSYEVERRMIRLHEAEPENTPEARKTRGNLMRFRRTEGRTASMPVLGMVYPSRTLATVCDPLVFAAGKPELPTLADVIAWAASRIDPLLKPLTDDTPAEGPEDDQWYWAAPILLDLADHEVLTRAWFARDDLASRWSGRDESEGEQGEGSAWAEHVARARALLGDHELGRVPADLTEVLAQLAVGGPATCALRTFRRINNVADHPVHDQTVADGAARVGWAFPPLFNLPDVTALLRGLDGDEAYWRRALAYCCAGGMQSMLDELGHVLLESEALLGRPVPDMVESITRKIVEALGVRTSSLGVDVISVSRNGEAVDTDRQHMRARFAMRFGDETSEDSKDVTRAGQVRDAFNSPFWPFVLASTSVGQEGLDFHPYAHAVVHWDLPSNPVDLEQREGRVHRYKGHAIRKNLARHYGLGGLVAPKAKAIIPDPWRSLFIDARVDRGPDESDLVPFWVYPIEGGAKIERHVPALPLSQESDALEALRRSLAMYRMVFGQPRQTDLLAYLVANVPAEDVARIAAELRLDLGPRRDAGNEANAGATSTGVRTSNA